MVAPRLHPQFTAEYRLFRPAPGKAHELIELREAAGTRIFTWRMQVTPLTQTSSTFQAQGSESHLEGTQHVETWEGLTESRIHTSARLHAETETLLANGPAVSDVFVKWEHKRSYLTGYPLPQRELTTHYQILGIEDGATWHVFRLAPIGQTDENAIPAWDTYNTAYQPADTSAGTAAAIGKFIRGGGHDCQPWLQLPSGTEVSISVRSFLNRSGENMEVLNLMPQASERPPGETDAEGQSINAGTQYMIPPGMMWDDIAEELNGAPSVPPADANGNRRAFYYPYFVAKNNFGADVGFLKIEIYHPDDGATPHE